jgi:hypothetical protein
MNNLSTVWLIFIDGGLLELYPELFELYDFVVLFF